MGRFGALVLALALGLALAIRATTPPAPVPASAPPTMFSAERAMADVRAVASAPHATGTEENARVRALLVARMQALGLEVSSEQGTVDARGTEKRNRWTGRNDPPVALTNLIGVLPGRDRAAPSVLLMAHHDSVWGSPGAADDTAGAAATLEVVRAIKAQGQPQRDVIVLLTDAEELGLIGARQFFTANPLRDHIGAVINMEARGGGGRTTLFQTSHQNGSAVRLYAGAVTRPGASSLSAFVYSVLPNDTDLSPVIKGPHTAYNFAFIGRSGLYHSPLATPDRLDQGALQDMGGQVLGLTSALLAAPQLPGKTPDAVFFDLFGLLTVTYAAWLGWVFLALAGGGLVTVLRRHGRAGALGAGGRMLGLIVLSALVLYLLNWLSLGLAPPNYYDRLAAIPRLEAIAGLGGLAAFLLTMGRWNPGRGEIAGAALPLFVLGALAQAFAPTAAYVLVLPLLLVAAGLLLPGRSALTGIAALVLGYMIALGHQLMQGVGPSMPSAAALPLAIGALALLPLWPGWNRARSGATAALIAAAAIALWVQLDAPAESRAVYSDSKK